MTATRKDVLHTYTLYAHPADYPGRYVVRRFACGAFGVIPDPEPWCVAHTLDAARLSVPRGMVWHPREETDDPCIVESYF